MEEAASLPFPTKVKVGWMDYEIEVWAPREAAQASKYGETRPQCHKIAVDLSYGSRQAAATLLHEVMHATLSIFRIYDEDKEERTVTMMEHGLATVWRDNPDVMAWIGYNLVHGTN